MSNAVTVESVINEIKESVKTSKNGKPVKSFSRSLFDKLANAIVNDPDYSYEVYSVRGGKVETKSVKPAELYRAGLKIILQDFGVDKQEAAKILDTAYQIPSAKGIYELAAASIYEYIDAGKSFAFPTRENFTGSISLSDVAESITTHRNIQNPSETFKVKQKAHKRLEKKSKTAAWLKSRV